MVITECGIVFVNGQTMHIKVGDINNNQKVERIRMDHDIQAIEVASLNTETNEMHFSVYMLHYMAQFTYE
jgi:hypothetical protein